MKIAPLRASTSSGVCVKSRGTRRYFCLMILGAMACVQFLVLVKVVNVDTFGFAAQHWDATAGYGAGAKIATMNQLGNGKYAVWMFPFPPQAPLGGMKTESALLSHEETLICAYSHACKSFEGHKKINLRELTDGTYYHNYVRDHSYHKVRHTNDFPYHIQAITMLGLLKSNKEGEGNVCVRTLGGRTEFCDDKEFSSYDPYESEELNSTNFPYTFVSDGRSEDGDYFSLAPREMLTAEKFAIWGVLDMPRSNCARYNSGEDVQSYAGAAWLPFISEIRDKENAIHDYNGYYIGNSLMGSTSFNYTEADFENMNKITLTSIYSTAPGLDGMASYLRNYTTHVSPFGSRSTVTDRFLKDRKIKSYFSACLTLTTNMQGAVLNDHPLIHDMFILKPNATALLSPKQKTKIIFLDVVDPEAVPKSALESENAIHLTADVGRRYPNCNKKMPRYDYSYKLLSIYANQAKVVVTSRIHAGLPAAALGIPVIFVEGPPHRKKWLPGGKQSVGRVEGLLDVFHRVQRGVDGKNWSFGNLTDDVPHSEGVHLADRYRASFWNRLKKTHYYRDAARMFGMIPFQRLGQNNVEIGIEDTFHFVMESTSGLSWQTKRAIEHVFYFHPNCKVFVHSNDTGPNDLEIFAETGYNLMVQPYDLDSLLKEVSSVKLQSHDLLQASLPLLLLSKFGGIYLSKDTLILKKIAADIEEGVVLHENGDIAMAHFGRESQDVSNRLNTMTSRTLSETSVNLTWKFPVLSDLDTVKCSEDIKWALGDDLNEAIAVSLHPSSYASIETIKMDTECYRFVEKQCIFCDEIHWDFN